MARTDLEQLQFQMAADISQLQKQLKKALADTTAASDKIDKRLKKVGEGMNLGKALDAVFDRSRFAVIEEGGAKLSVFGSALEYLGPAGIAAAAGIAALGVSLEATEKALEFADAIYKTAKNAHVSTDALQEYQFALRAVGGNEDQAGAALASFSDKLGRAQAGMPRAIKAFEALGFTPEQIKGWKSAEEALPLVAEAISKLKNSAQQDAAISMTGLDGLKLLIEQGPEKMRELISEAGTAGNVMDANLVQKGHEMNEQMETLKKKISVELNSAFVDLGPILIWLTKMLADMASWAQKIADRLAPIADRSTNALKDQQKYYADRLNDPVKSLLTGDRDRQKLAEINAELARRAANPPGQPPPAKPDGTSLNFPTNHRGMSAADKRAAGEQALLEAQDKELKAQQALTDNVEQILQFKLDEIDTETKKKNDSLRRQIADGKIDAALATQAIEENTKAADLEKEKARRDAQEKLDDQFFAVQQQTAQVYDRIASIYASMATTVQARLQIERAALLQRQREERDALQREFDRQKVHGTFDQSRADMQTATQRDSQAAELKQLEDGAVKEMAGNFKDLMGGAVDALRNHKNVMEYLADSFGEKLLSNLEDVAARWLAQQVIDAPQGSLLATIGNVIGHRAGGGDVNAGSAYVVGESGQEVFVPGVSGTILSNRMLNARVGAGRGAVVVNQYISANGSILAQDFIDYVDRSKQQAIRAGAVQGAAVASVLVPAQLGKAQRQRYR